MKFVSFNVNGIRARFHQLETLIQVHDPDVIGIQETKVQDSEFPLDVVGELGYHVSYFGQKGHYGVAMLSRLEPETVQRGFPGDAEDAQRRLITGSFSLPSGQRLTVINGYFPQGESRDHPAKFPAKRKFYEDLQEYLRVEYSPDDWVVVMGDMNISTLDQDIGIGPDNAKRWLRTGKCSFLPEEREWIERLKAWGLKDTFRELNPDVDDSFSWFDYRSRGFDREPKRGLRIDLILATNPMIASLRGAGICYDIRGMEKSSDHCPVWAEFGV